MEMEKEMTKDLERHEALINNLSGHRSGDG